MNNRNGDFNMFNRIKYFCKDNKECFFTFLLILLRMFFFFIISFFISLCFGSVCLVIRYTILFDIEIMSRGCTILFLSLYFLFLCLYGLKSVNFEINDKIE